MPSTPASPVRQQPLSDAGRGYALGILGVVIFAMTLPMTRLAVGDTSAPQLAPAVAALGTLVGFPLFLGLALRQVDAMHAAVVTGVMPLGAAVVGALVLRQRPSTGFWVCALLFAVPVLGETLEQTTLVFSLAVIAVVFIGRRMPVAAPSSTSAITAS